MEDEYSIPAPDFLPGSRGVYCENAEESSQLYRHIMFCLLQKEPRLNPQEIFESMPNADGMDERGHRQASRACSNKVFELIHPLLEDELFMQFVAIRCNCTFSDIIFCMGAYYGDIAFGKMQLARHIRKIVESWSQETREVLGV